MCELSSESYIATKFGTGTPGDNIGIVPWSQECHDTHDVCESCAIFHPYLVSFPFYTIPIRLLENNTGLNCPKELNTHTPKHKQVQCLKTLTNRVNHQQVPTE